MKIGIISDTHDDIENVQRAIDLFGREEVKLIIHAGDFVFPGIIDEFKNLKNYLFLISLKVLALKKLTMSPCLYHPLVPCL
jgi:putative phosphoesterase